MSVDTCRNASPRAIWRGPFECPQCGSTDKSLKEKAYPKPIAVLGNSGRVMCRICGKQFLVKTQGNPTDAAEGGSGAPRIE